MSRPEIRVTSRYNRIMAVVVWALAALAVVTALWSGTDTLVWVFTGAPLAALLGWVGLWRPYVGVSDAGVHLENVSHRVDVPWEALVHIDTRRALTLYTPAGAFVAWSAPAPGFLASLASSARQARRESRAAGGAALREGDRLGTDSGDAATVVRERWQARLDAGQVQLGVADETPVRRQWHVTLIAVCVMLGAATIWLITVTA